MRIPGFSFHSCIDIIVSWLYPCVSYRRLPATLVSGRSLWAHFTNAKLSACTLDNTLSTIEGTTFFFHRFVPLL
jgi:hypothetical protein